MDLGFDRGRFESHGLFFMSGWLDFKSDTAVLSTAPGPQQRPLNRPANCPANDHC